MFYLIATPIGNIADITLRALETLESCRVLLCEDTRVSKKLIAILHSRNLLSNTDFQYISLHSHNESSRIKSLNLLGIDFINQNIALLSDAGMPCISDPGAKLVQFVQRHNIPYTIIPGASSILSAFALCGFEAKAFKFIGFLPHKSSEKELVLRKILPKETLHIFLDSPKRILDTFSILQSLAPHREIFVAKELTKVYEKYFFGTISKVYTQLLETNLAGEWIVALKGNSSLSPQKTLGIEDIDRLDIPPKIKAKILAQMTSRKIKDCYDEILQKG